MSLKSELKYITDKGLVLISFFKQMALLYSDEKSVLGREINIENGPKLSKDELSDVFELERCISWISEHQLSKVSHVPYMMLSVVSVLPLPFKSQHDILFPPHVA